MEVIRPLDRVSHTPMAAFLAPLRGAHVYEGDRWLTHTGYRLLSLRDERAACRQLARNIVSACIFAVMAVSAVAETARPTVSGEQAVLLNGIAHAPSRAPAAVKNAIWAINTIQKKPYVWGGGHATFFDRGYDCSGTVCFMLHFAGLLNQPAPSNELMAFGEAGPGRWITLYVRRGHVFAVVAGLRLDTTGRVEGEGPRWRAEYRAPSGFEARHPKGF